jgi:hypothetical protein
MELLLIYSGNTYFEALLVEPFDQLSSYHGVRFLAASPEN